MTRISCLQLDAGVDESPDERLERVIALVNAEGPHADVIVLPELWWTGYFSFDRYAAEARALDDAVFGRFGALARRHRLHLFAGTFVERGATGLANCAVTFGPDGALLHAYRKVHLFGYQSQEAKLLVPGGDVEVAPSALGPLAATTCYDLRFPELYRVLVDRGARLIVIPAAWPAARRAHWRVLLQARAIENQVVVLACNGAGRQGGVELAGHSAIIDPWGRVVAEAGTEPTVLRAELDLAEVDRVREEFPVLAHRRLAVDGHVAADSSVAARP